MYVPLLAYVFHYVRCLEQNRKYLSTLIIYFRKLNQMSYRKFSYPLSYILQGSFGLLRFLDDLKKNVNSIRTPMSIQGRLERTETNLIQIKCGSV